MLTMKGDAEVLTCGWGCCSECYFFHLGGSQRITGPHHIPRMLGLNSFLLYCQTSSLGPLRARKPGIGFGFKDLARPVSKILAHSLSVTFALHEPEL